MKKYFLIIFLFLTCSLSFGAEDYYRFDTKQQQQRFEELISQLRCLVCQNQTIAESNAALAVDLRGQVYQQIQRGESNQKIREYLIARYGHYILYSPPMNITTLGLWLGPLIILIMGLGYLFYYIRKRQNE